jgi:hypothetical protein
MTRNNCVLACLHGWDTHEPVDGYNLLEMRKLQIKLEDAIVDMIKHDPNQLMLF